MNILEQKRPIYSKKIRYPQQANQEKKNELTYYYSSEENESLDGSFGDPAIVKYIFFFSDLLGPGLELVSKELNHFGVIAGDSGRLGVTVVDLCYFALFEDFSL